MKLCVPLRLSSSACFLILMDVSADLIVNQHNIWLINKKHQTEGVLVCRISGSWGIYSAIAGSVLVGGEVGDPGDSYQDRCLLWSF